MGISGVVARPSHCCRSAGWTAYRVQKIRRSLPNYARILATLPFGSGWGAAAIVVGGLSAAACNVGSPESKTLPKQGLSIRSV